MVMHFPAVVDVEKWVDNENVTAVVAAGLPGKESGASLVPVLWGDVAPSGKLSFTWGKNLSDYSVSLPPSFECDVRRTCNTIIIHPDSYHNTIYKDASSPIGEGSFIIRAPGT